MATNTPDKATLPSEEPPLSALPDEPWRILRVPDHLHARLAPAEWCVYEWTEYRGRFAGADCIRIGSTWQTPVVDDVFLISFENQLGLTTITPYRNGVQHGQSLRFEVLARKFTSPTESVRFLSAMLDDLFSQGSALPFITNAPTARQVRDSFRPPNDLFAFHFFRHHREMLIRSLQAIVGQPHRVLADESAMVRLHQVKRIEPEAMFRMLQIRRPSTRRSSNSWRSRILATRHCPQTRHSRTSHRGRCRCWRRWRWMASCPSGNEELMNMSTGRDNWMEQPRQTTGSLTSDLRRLGLGAGDIVLVHSSLRGLGHVEGGAGAVIDALLDAVGPAGTVLFPTLTGSPADGLDAPPIMDVRATPCWTGRIPETARQRQGAIRSLHPTHSIAALGARAGRYASGHESGESPCDTHSPYFRLITEGGFILLLGGVGQESNTTLHCLEERANVPYHLQEETTDGVVIDANGNRRIVRNRLHLWRNRLYPEGLERDFPRINGALKAGGAMRSGRVGQSTSALISAQAMAGIVLPFLEKDPLYLLSQHGRRLFAGTAP